ncbi:dockerin type I domain-containing protein [Halorussus salinus]|uniref:dockerin type I domain-containing protein n=1 Tax=Halorussus salinus TaxID=1364935 RepID=UPI001091D010|nr:dockerin type I domain-containing protein [Halorussus salinus]
MTQADGIMVTGVTALTVALLVAVAAFAPVAAVPQPDDSIGLQQSVAGDATVIPGDTVTLETTVNATGYNAPGVDVALPDGWTIQSQSTNGPFTYKASTTEWVGLSGGEYTITYTVAVPNDVTAGDYTISVDGSAIDPDTDEFVTQSDGSTITVQDDSTTTVEPPTTTTEEPPTTTTTEPTTTVPGEMSVSQSADGPVAPGGTVTMTAQVDTTGLDAPALDVNLPDGWSVQSQTADGPASYKPSTNEWIWAAGDVDQVYTVEYVVAVPDDASEGDYTITADASALDADDNQVTDSAVTSVTVAGDGGGEQPTGPTSEVNLSPASELTGLDQTTTFDVVVTDVDGGIGVYDLTVSLDDTNVGTITDATVVNSGSSALSDVQVADDGASATLEVVLADTADTGAVTVAIVTVETANEGTTDLNLDVAELGTEGGSAYEVTATDGATLEVSQLVVGDSANPAADGDGDGLYEDINGDGSVTMNDLQTLWSARNSVTIANNPEAFDFNGDGQFTILDIQALYSQELSA